MKSHLVCRRKVSRAALASTITMLLLIVIFIFPRLVLAQEEAPRWRKTLTCIPSEQFYQGVEYCTGKVTSQDGEHTAHVIVVDTHASGVRLEYIISEGVDRRGTLGPCRDVNRTAKGKIGCDTPGQPQYYPVMTFEQAIKRAQALGAAALINGDYSACTQSEVACGLQPDGTPNYREHGPEGLAVVQGERLDGIAMYDRDNNVRNRPWLAIEQTPRLKVEIHQWRSEPEGLPYPRIYTGMGGGPWLVQDGTPSPAIETCSDPTPTPGNCCVGVSMSSCRKGIAQTAVGITADARWLFLVVVEKNTPTVNDLADFMIENLDCNQAIKLDGGGSTGMWYHDDEKYMPSRELTNFLAVIAESGSGIVLPVDPAPEPEPEPSPQPNWNDRILEWWHQTQIYRRWEEFVQRLEELQRTIEDLQELVHNIQDPEWWAEQALNWMLQCCSSAFVPAGLVGGGLFLRRRRLSKIEMTKMAWEFKFVRFNFW